MTLERELRDQALTQQREVQETFQALLEMVEHPRKKAILRDLLLYEEMNEWVLRNMLL